MKKTKPISITLALSALFLTGCSSGESSPSSSVDFTPVEEITIGLSSDTGNGSDDDSEENSGTESSDGNSGSSSSKEDGEKDQDENTSDGNGDDDPNEENGNGSGENREEDSSDPEEGYADIDGYFEQPSLYRDIENCIKEGTVLDNYGGGKGYALLKHALNKQAKSPYSLTVGKATVKASIANQEVESATFNTPEVTYNQNISSSTFVHTANKFYDYGNDNVTAYLGSTASEWKTAEATNYTYDEFIQSHGKLQRGNYYCTDSEEQIPDSFLTLDREEFINSTEKTKHEINAVIIYDLSTEYITGVSTSANEETGGYVVTLELASEAMDYYAVQMEETGGLNGLPTFDPSTIRFELSPDLYPVSSIFNDSYQMKYGFIPLTGSQTMYQWYYHSDTNVFDGVEVDIPDPTDTEFDGYELLPEE